MFNERHKLMDSSDIKFILYICPNINIYIYINANEYVMFNQRFIKN